MDDLDVLPDFSKDDSIKEIISAMKDGELKDIMRVWEEKHPHRSARLKRILSSALSNPPMNGVLIRRSMLVALVTFLEIFLEDTYKNYHLILGKSKSEAEKEAGKLMNGHWRDNKIANLHKIGLVIPSMPKYIDEIFEIAQRRNSLVHNDGVVDETYQRHIPNKYEIGRQLLVPTKYFQRAVDIIHVVAFLLFYNQLKQNERNLHSRDIIMDDFVLSSLRNKRYLLIVELSKNLESLNLPRKREQIMLANRAIAFRDMENTEEVREIVSFLENEEHEWQIDIAVSMLSNNISKLKSQLRQYQNESGFIEISQWPLFDPIQNETWFKMALMKKNKTTLHPKIGRNKRN